MKTRVFVHQIAIAALAGLLWLVGQTSALAWSEHALLTYPVFVEQPEVRDAGPVKVETIESFLMAEKEGLARVLADEEAWARKNLRWYRPLPDGLAFAPVSDAQEIRKRFCRAIRISSGASLMPYCQLLPGQAVGERPVIPVERLTFLTDKHSWKHTVMVGLSSGETVSAVAVLSTASDEPDLGLDVGLFADNKTEEGSLYGFGRQPFGNPHLDYGSQAPFHMGFYHEPKIVYLLASFLGETYPEYRIHLYARLARYAFRTGHSYWGWRFAGWGLHYVGDLAQPYHSTVLPDVSTVRALWINSIATIGIKKPKEHAIQLVSNRHLALERFLQIDLRRAYAEPRTNATVLATLRAPDAQRPYDDTVPRERVAKAAHAQAALTSRTVVHCMPSRYVSDPNFEFGTSPDQHQIVERIQAEKEEEAVAKLRALCGNLLVPYREWGRSYLRDIVAASRVAD